MFDDLELEFGMFDEETAFFQSEPEEPEFDEEEPDYEEIMEKDIEENDGLLNFRKEKSGGNFEEPELEEKTEADKLFEQAAVTSYKKETPKKDNKKQEGKKEKKAAVKKEEVKKVFNTPTPEKKTTPKVAVEKQEQKTPEKKEQNEPKPKKAKTDNPQNIPSEESARTMFDMNDDFDVENMAADSNWESGKKVEFNKKTSFNMDFNEENYFKKTPDNEDNVNMAGASNVFTEDDIEIIEDENCFDSGIPNKEEFKEYKPKKKMPESLKKLVMFASMFGIVIGIPVIIAALGNHNKSTKDGINEIKIYSESQNTTESAGDVKTTLFTEAEKSSNIDSDGITSSRFANLDELSLYIESNTGSLLSSEMQAVNMYEQGSMTTDGFITTMQDYISQANTLNHLLLVNKDEYENEDREEEYTNLSENLDTLMIYGDMKVYNAENETSKQ